MPDVTADLAALFDRGPPPHWTPREGERVAVYIGGTPGGFVFDSGTVTDRFETAHFSGNPVVSYRVDLGSGWLQVSRNNMRPLP